MTEFSQRRAPEAGFSLVELLLVLGMMAMLAGMAVIQIAASRPGAVGEGGMQFLTVSGLPDTPDAFGNASAVTFPTATGSPLEIKFATDGTFVNQDGLSLNGTVFVALPNQALSARAVTIFGSTGRVRAYRWDGRIWKR